MSASPLLGLGDSDPDWIVEADNMEVLPALPDGSFTVVYADPPFNTGRAQRRQETTVRARPLGAGDRVGFRGQSFETVTGRLRSYDDAFGDYWDFLFPRLEQAWRLLADDGTLYLHLDYREVHYAKIMLDAVFGRDCFLNEIVWAYDYGAKTKKRWPSKHDTILVYVKNPSKYHFDNSAVDREPYMAPGLVTAAKVKKGKLPTDVWWHTIVSPTGREKTGYPTQKPMALIRRMITASSREGDWILDFFAGSGTTGAAATRIKRRFVLIDSNPDAIEVMSSRLKASDGAGAKVRVVRRGAGTPSGQGEPGRASGQGEPGRASGQGEPGRPSEPNVQSGADEPGTADSAEAPASRRTV